MDALFTGAALEHCIFGLAFTAWMKCVNGNIIIFILRIRYFGCILSGCVCVAVVDMVRWLLCVFFFILNLFHDEKWFTRKFTHFCLQSRTVRSVSGGHIHNFRQTNINRSNAYTRKPPIAFFIHIFGRMVGNEIRRKKAIEKKIYKNTSSIPYFCSWPQNKYSFSILYFDLVRCSALNLCSHVDILRLFLIKTVLFWWENENLVKVINLCVCVLNLEWSTKRMLNGELLNCKSNCDRLKNQIYETLSISTCFVFL